MAEKPLDGLLIVMSPHAMSSWDAQALRDSGAVIIFKRPNTELEVKRLATGEPLEAVMDIMDTETWAGLVELRERLINAGAKASAHILKISGEEFHHNEADRKRQ